MQIISLDLGTNWNTSSAVNARRAVLRMSLSRVWAS